MDEGRREVEESERAASAVRRPRPPRPVRRLTPLQLAAAKSAERAARHLLTARQQTGAWSGFQAPSPGVTSRYLLLQSWISDIDPDLKQRLAALLIDQQLPCGGWQDHERGCANLGTSVMAYTALRQLGYETESMCLLKAREMILAGGGVEASDPMTRYLLAVVGQVSYDLCPMVPPEMVLLPAWLPLHLNIWSHWTRTLIVPMSMIWAIRPSRRLVDVGEIFRAGPPLRFARIDVTEAGDPKELGYAALRWFGEAMIRLLERGRLTPFRAYALDAAEQWVVERTSAETGLAGSPDATIFATFALLARGHQVESTAVQNCLAALRRMLGVTDEQEESPAHAAGPPGPVTRTLARSATATIRDTALAMSSMANGCSEYAEPGLRRSLEWLLRHEIQQPGDWSLTTAGDAGGWSRDLQMRHYPDTVSTALALIALREQFAASPPSSVVADDSMVAMIRANSRDLAHREIALLDRVAAASRRARRWLVAMQNPDGGWGHATRFRVRRRSLAPQKRLAANLPLVDASTPAATGRVLQALGRWEMRCGQQTIDRAVSYLRRVQTPLGYWPQGHDAGAIETTWSAVAGLRAVGVRSRDQTLTAAVHWLMETQRDDGGWDEVDKLSREVPHSHGLDTAWAVLTLLLAGRSDSESVQRGIGYLVHAQQPDGSWPSSSAGPRRRSLIGYDTSVVRQAIPLQALHDFAQ